MSPLALQVAGVVGLVALEPLLLLQSRRLQGPCGVVLPLTGDLYAERKGGGGGGGGVSAALGPSGWRGTAEAHGRRAAGEEWQCGNAMNSYLQVLSGGRKHSVEVERALQLVKDRELELERGLQEARGGSGGDCTGSATIRAQERRSGNPS